MANIFYTTETFHVDHSTFGGVIYPSDFETDYREKYNPYGSNIASRIMSDMRFDKQCKKNIEIREKKKNWQC